MPLTQPSFMSRLSFYISFISSYHAQNSLQMEQTVVYVPVHQRQSVNV